MKKLLIDICIAIAAVLAPIQAVIYTIGILVLADMVLGIWAAKKRGEAITSKKMSSSIIKLLVYQVTIITAFLIEKYLSGGLLPVTKIAGSVIGICELKSLGENSSVILGQPIMQSIYGILKNQAVKKLDIPKEDQ
jgi:hypothetical protein